MMIAYNVTSMRCRGGKSKRIIEVMMPDGLHYFDGIKAMKDAYPLETFVNRYQPKTKRNPRHSLLADHAAAIAPKARKVRKNPAKRKAVSKHRVLVQAGLSNKGPWITISAYPDTDTGKASAIAEAKKIHSKTPNQPVRVWLT